MAKARQEVEGLAKDIDDVLIYALYPTTGKRFLRWKYSLEEPPEEVKAKTFEDVQREKELIEKAKKGLVVEKPERQAPTKGPGVRTFNVFVDEEYYQVEVEPVDGRAIVSSISQSTGPQPDKSASVQERAGSASSGQEPSASESAAKAEKEQVVSTEGGTHVDAPMPGMIISYEVEEGEEVHEGDPLLILEAMKMENSIAAPVAGKVKQLNFADGDSVQKGDVLLIIE